MAQVINTNIASLNAQRNLTGSQNAINTSLQRLSTGLRINSAKDDAAGLAISERMTTQINGLNQAVRNANDGISLAQTAEGALSQIGDNLQRIRQLAVQSSSATNSAEDRGALQKEVSQLVAEIQRVSKDTAFNGTSLLDGSFASKTFQVGANQGQTISIDNIANANIDALGSWTTKTTNAVVTGSGPEGTPVAAVNGTAVITVAGLNAPTPDDPTTPTSYDYAASTITVNGMELDVAAATGDTAAAARASLLGNINTALNDAGLNGLTATVDTATAGSEFITFSNSSSAEYTIKGSTFAGTFTAKAATPASAEFAALANGDITINGESIGAIGKTTNAATRLSSLVTAINAKTETTGVTASVDAGRLKLTSTTGDITVGGAAAAADLLRETGMTAGTSAAGATNLAGSTSYAEGTAQVGFKDLDISTVDGAENAILAMDAALKSVNESRADLGAIQNRFSSVVSSLQTTSENLSASRSRILDADFAAETASLTRAQILQQAGTAMLAQANSLPNNVLTLLRG